MQRFVMLTLVVSVGLFGCRATHFVYFSSYRWEMIQGVQEVLVANDGSIAIKANAVYGKDQGYPIKPRPYGWRKRANRSRFIILEPDQVAASIQLGLELKHKYGDSRILGGEDPKAWAFFDLYGSPQSNNLGIEKNDTGSEFVQIVRLPLQIQASKTMPQGTARIPARYITYVPRKVFAYAIEPISPYRDRVGPCRVIPQGFKARDAEEDLLPDKFKTGVRRYRSGVPADYVQNGTHYRISFDKLLEFEVRRRYNPAWWILYPIAIPIDILTGPFVMWDLMVTTTGPYYSRCQEASGT